MLTNNKKNFVRSISMLLAMLMVLAVCLTGCGNKEALTKAEEAKTAADSVMAALSGYIAKDDVAAVEALVKAALDDSVATADELDALAAKLESYVTVNDVAALIKDEVAKTALGSAMTKDEILEILKGYYTKEEVDAKLESYFGEFAPEQVLAMISEAMTLEGWNEATDEVLATIGKAQELLESVGTSTYLNENKKLLNEKLAPLGIVAFADEDEDGKYETRTDNKEFAEKLEFALLRVPTVKELAALQQVIADALAVPTFESEFDALKAKLFALGELVTIGDYDGEGANKKFVAETWTDQDKKNADGDFEYHGVKYAKGDEKKVQVVTLADKAAFHELTKAYDALLGKYDAEDEGKTAYMVYEVANNGVLSIKTVAVAKDAQAPENATERGLLAYTTVNDAEYLAQLYIDGKLTADKVLKSPLFEALDKNVENLQCKKADHEAIKAYEVIYTDLGANIDDVWEAAYAAVYAQLTYVQGLANAVNDKFAAKADANGAAPSFLYSTIFSKTSAMMTKDYATITDAEFLAALTAAMCEFDGVTVYPVYLNEMYDLVKPFLLANNQSYNGFDKADLYKSMLEKTYDLLWPTYKEKAQKDANKLLNDYLSVVFDAKNHDFANKAEPEGEVSPKYDNLGLLVEAMKAYNLTEADLTEGFVAKFYEENLAKYYVNNGKAMVAKAELAEGEEYRGATLNKDGNGTVTDAAGYTVKLWANPVKTIAFNAEWITLRLTGSKLYVDMQIGAASKDAYKASGEPVQEAFDEILEDAKASFEEIYNRFLVDAYNSDDYSDYQKMTLNDATALAEEIINYYDMTTTAEERYVKMIQHYLTGVSSVNGASFSKNTVYTVTSYKITRFTAGKNELEGSVQNFKLVSDIAGITINHFDTSSSEGVKLVGTEAMAEMDALKKEALAVVEDIMVKVNFETYLNIALGSLNDLWVSYYRALEGKTDNKNYSTETLTQLHNKVGMYQDTIAVFQFYAELDGYALNEYKSVYTTELLPLIAGANKDHLALLSGKDIFEILADKNATAPELAAGVLEDGLKDIKTTLAFNPVDDLDENFKDWVSGCKFVTPYDSVADYKYIGSAAEEIDALLNAETAYTTNPNGAIVKLY